MHVVCMWRSLRLKPNAHTLVRFLSQTWFISYSILFIFYLQYIHVLDSHCDEHMSAMKEIETRYWENTNHPKRHDALLNTSLAVSCISFTWIKGNLSNHFRSAVRHVIHTASETRLCDTETKHDGEFPKVKHTVCFFFFVVVVVFF